MKILIDTNVVLDVLLNREPFVEASASVLKLCESDNFQGFITATTITDIYYILCKNMPDKSLLYNALEKLLSITEICDVTKHIVFNAIKLRESDFEDAIQAQCAKSIDAAYIVTRDVSGYINSNVKAITPSSFLLIV